MVVMSISSEAFKADLEEGVFGAGLDYVADVVFLFERYPNSRHQHRSHRVLSSRVHFLDKASRDLFSCAKYLFAEAKEGQLAPLHSWLTNRINIPTAINRASRVPTANERARFRRSNCFDLAPCAAPIPNQKRSLSIVVSAVIGAVLWWPYYAYDYGEFPYSASAKSPSPGRGYLARRRRERQRRR